MAAAKSKRRPRLPKGPRFSNLTLLEPVDGTCIVCGCTEDDACEGGCSWVDLTCTNLEGRLILCSRCSDEIAGTLIWSVLTHAGVVVR